MGRGKGHVLQQRRARLWTANRPEQFDGSQRDILLIDLEPLTNRHDCRAIELAQVIVFEVEEVNTVFLEQVEERFTVGGVLLVGVDDKSNGNEHPQSRKEPGQSNAFQ